MLRNQQQKMMIRDGKLMVVALCVSLHQGFFVSENCLLNSTNFSTPQFISYLSITHGLKMFYIMKQPCSVSFFGLGMDTMSHLALFISTIRTMHAVVFGHFYCLTPLMTKPLLSLLPERIVQCLSGGAEQQRLYLLVLLGVGVCCLCL